MTTLQGRIRKLLEDQADQYASEYTPEDVYRAFSQQSRLLQETARLQTSLQAGSNPTVPPLKSMDDIIECLLVTACHRVQTKCGYSAIDAVVRVDCKGLVEKSRKLRKDIPEFVDLIFRYEREGRNDNITSTSATPTRVWFSIDFKIPPSSHSKDNSNCQSQKLLWCQIWAPQATPTTHISAINVADTIDAEEADGWSDMEDEDEISNEHDTAPAPEARPASKRRRSGSSNSCDSNENGSKESLTNPGDNTGNSNEEADRYYAGMDPDVLAQFRQCIGLPLPQEEAENRNKLEDNNEIYDDGSLFFWLMSFPFYEHEWDIVGFLLEAVFGGEEQ